jgi:metallophosphoesterase (TIGR03767 family)
VARTGVWHDAPMSRLLAALALLALFALAPASLADPTGRSTLQETVRPGSGSGFVPLVSRGGERYVVRRGGRAKARRGRSDRRRSIAFFAQLTDPQIADEMSPARVDFVDPAGGALKDSLRPQEALGLQVFDATVRNVNANRRSRVRDGRGRRARLRFALATGDLADNQQLNETRWFRTVLDGGRVDPFSGKPIGPSNPCNESPPTIARLNDDVANRRYTGLQDYDDWRGAPPDRYAGYWDPDEAAPTPGPYAAFPRYPGLMERAQVPFRAAGLDVPWLIARGNHDGLLQGNAPASTDLFRAIAVSCTKIFPSGAIDPARFAGQGEDAVFRQFNDPAFIATLLASARPVPPDPDRRIISKAEYRDVIGGHGFGSTSRRELQASRGTASYYSLRRSGIRFISLDTVAEGGGSTGNLDHPQYRWLRRQLRRADRRGEIVVVFGHHTLGTMTNPAADEAAGSCSPPDEPGCDTDPRRSTPIHRGLEGRATARSLLARHRSVIAFVAGHTHENEVQFYGGRRGRGFWEINTASHVDWPQQSRLIQVMDNRDGTLSIFGTILDSAAPAEAPAPANAMALSLRDLVSLSRTLSWNDPQRAGLPASGETGNSLGRRRDRNVELLVRDPR